MGALCGCPQLAEVPREPFLQRSLLPASPAQAGQPRSLFGTRSLSSCWGSSELWRHLRPHDSGWGGTLGYSPHSRVEVSVLCDGKGREVAAAGGAGSGSGVKVREQLLCPELPTLASGHVSGGPQSGLWGLSSVSPQPSGQSPTCGGWVGTRETASSCPSQWAPRLPFLPAESPGCLSVWSLFPAFATCMAWSHV